MSIIIALKTSEDSIVLGSDGRITYGDNIITDEVCKWIPINHYHIGISGYYRSFPLIENLLKIKRSDSPFSIITKIRSIFNKDGYFNQKNDDGPITSNSEIIIVHSKNIYGCRADFAPCNSDLNYLALGSGGPHAQGFLYCSIRNNELLDDNASEALVREAIKCSMRFNNNCGGHIYTKILP